MRKKNLTAGQTLPATAPEPFDPEETNPSIIANVVLDHRASSVREDVKSHVAFSTGVNALLDDKEALDKLLAILLDRKILSTDDVRVGLSAPESYLSMLNKISKYRDVLLDERILRYVSPGYSVLYQLACLYEDLEKCDGLN
jgi:hypothetical protein